MSVRRGFGRRERLEPRVCLTSMGFVSHAIDEPEISGWNGMALADIDGDGDLDFVGGSVGWRENVDGAGTFGPSQAISHDTVQTLSPIDEKYPDPDQALVVDWDEDGDLDVLLSAGSAVIYYELLDREYAEVQELVPLTGPEWQRHWKSGLTAADVTGDGRDDLVQYVKTQTTQSVIVHPRRLAGLLDTPEVFVVGDDVLLHDLIAHDIDLDGDVDLTTVPQYRDGWRWLENQDGVGGFVQRRTASDFGLTVWAVGDLDLDGDPDLVSGNLRWHEQRPIGDSDGDGSFSAADLVFAMQAGEYLDDVSGNSDFIEGDWNGDGDFDEQDIVAAFVQDNFTYE